MVKTDSVTKESNGYMSVTTNIIEEEVPLFNFGENSGLYFKPKSLKLGRLLTADKVQSAFIGDTEALKKNPYTLEFKEPRQSSKGRGLIVYKNYVNGVPKQYGIVNHWDSGIKLALSEIDNIKELAKENVTRAMSDSELANDE
tara:strand:+ start:992 stop:1420 length:429 start_codon:yes stop_codon:yes gene_type:complete